MCKSGIVFLLLLCSMSWSEAVVSAAPLSSDFECPHNEFWLPTQAELEKILTDHLAWLSELEESGQYDFESEQQARLCNASLLGSALHDANSPYNREKIDLRYADLNGAYMDDAELDGANLSFTKLNGAHLVVANMNNAILEGTELNGANLEGANLSWAYLSGAEFNCMNPGTGDEKCADLSNAVLIGANLKYAELNGANLSDAVLIGANLSGAMLNGANLEFAYLNCLNLELVEELCTDSHEADPICLNLEPDEELCTNLSDAELNGANLNDVSLMGANLRYATLIGATLKDVEARGVDLTNANLTESDLTDAWFDNSKLIDTKLRRAEFNGVRIDGATYEPASLPIPASLTNISGISEVKFHGNKNSGVVQLRTALKTSGDRDAEREATYLIKRNERIYLRENGRLLGRIESGFSFVMFELTSEWGRKPGRPLIIILVVFLIMIPVYTLAIAFGQKSRSESGVYKIEPKGRVVFSDGIPSLSDQDRVERLKVKWYAAIAYGAYFSLLSTFQIGWRELNVGAWISRLQPTELSFRARGWVRVASGAQSLISVYLLAIWALTYFGRPFG